MAPLGRKPRNLFNSIMMRFQRQPPKIQAFICVATALFAMVLIRILIHNHDNLFIAAELVHAVGIAVLIHKLTIEKTCAGLSLKSQELTALFLVVRLYCSFVMEYDIHTLLDTLTLATTCWVIYMIRYNLKSTYLLTHDNFSNYLVNLVSKEQPKVEESDEILVLEQISAYKERKVRGKMARLYLVKVQKLFTYGCKMDGRG
ncbi:hypothetical protein L7F22_007468 [Adiantum nelumboides]|nr:hypothetical protein [Adiantum nelumboides]